MAGSLIDDGRAWLTKLLDGSPVQSLWTVINGRYSVPNVAEIFNFFNPISLPLKCYTRIIEWHIATEEFDRGLYFVNDTFIQFILRVNSVDGYDVEIIENNILLLDHNTALKLNTTNGDVDFPINDVFLELR